jgi:hypothetical protein
MAPLHVHTPIPQPKEPKTHPKGWKVSIAKGFGAFVAGWKGQQQLADISRHVPDHCL